jgi:CubicO group peptidase (beta-lactamase class C family)
MGPGAFSTLRSIETDGSLGQAEGGRGMWWIPDDMAKIAALLNNNGGTIDGVQVLDPGLLAASLQRDAHDRGVPMGDGRMYNNAFWAAPYTKAAGFGCDLWVPHMMGVTGNVVALLPNGVTYYYFSDNQEFVFDAAVREAAKIAPYCK